MKPYHWCSLSLYLVESLPNVNTYLHSWKTAGRSIPILKHAGLRGPPPPDQLTLLLLTTSYLLFKKKFEEFIKFF